MSSTFPTLNQKERIPKSHEKGQSLVGDSGPLPLIPHHPVLDSGYLLPLDGFRAAKMGHLKSRCFSDARILISDGIGLHPGVWDLPHSSDTEGERCATFRETAWVVFPPCGSCLRPSFRDGKAVPDGFFCECGKRIPVDCFS